MENRMDSKLDVLNYKQMDGLRVFLNTLDYRTPHFHKELEILLILDGDLEILSERFHLSAGRGGHGAVQLGRGPRAAQKDEKLYHTLLPRGPFPSVRRGVGI